MKRECSFDTNTVGDLTNSDCLVDTCTLYADYYTFKGLDTCLVTFSNLYINTYGLSWF